MHARIVVSLLSLSLLAACGPKVPLEVGLRERSTDVAFGEQGSTAPPLPRAPSSDPFVSTAPGLITGPVTVGPGRPTPPAQPRDPRRPGRRLPPPPACPEGDRFADDIEAAPVTVSKGPKPGLYRFSRDGYFKLAKETTVQQPSANGPHTFDRFELSDELVREVKDVQEVSAPGRPPTIRYKVVQEEEVGTVVTRTTTAYLIDPGAGGSLGDSDLGGLHIEQIVVERFDVQTGPVGPPVAPKGVETFNPQPPVKLMDLPARPQVWDTNRISRGTDPLTSATMDVIRQTTARDRLDVCGTVIDTWRNEIWLTSVFDNDPQGVNGPTRRRFNIEGSFLFAPQLGGLVVFDDFKFGWDGTNVWGYYFPGIDHGRWFIQHSAAKLRSTTPVAD